MCLTFFHAVKSMHNKYLPFIVLTFQNEPENDWVIMQANINAGDRDNVVGTETRYGLEDTEFEPPWGLDFP